MDLRQGVSWEYVYIYIYIYIYLADVLKTNLTKFAVIWVKKGSKGTFLKPKKFQNRSNEAKGKEEKKKKQWLHS